MRGYRLGPGYQQDHVPVRQAAEVTGHAVRQLYLTAGVSDVYLETGEQTLLDKFNDDYQWFPLRDVDGGVLIVNRNRVVLVEPGPDLSPDLVRKESGAVFRRESVAVRCDGLGATLHGQIAMDLPDEFCRVSDFLNFPQDFFALETESGPVLVGKQHVVSLRALEAPPSVPGLQDTGVGERD